MIGKPTNLKAISILSNECKEMGHADAAKHLQEQGISLSRQTVAHLRRLHRIQWKNLKVASKWFHANGGKATIDELIARGLHPTYAERLIKRG